MSSRQNKNSSRKGAGVAVEPKATKPDPDPKAAPAKVSKPATQDYIVAVDCANVLGALYARGAIVTLSPAQARAYSDYLEA